MICAKMLYPVFIDHPFQFRCGLKGIVVGEIGARTTPFKSVGIYELVLQRYGISAETIDLSDIFARMRNVVKFTEPFCVITKVGLLIMKS